MTMITIDPKVDWPCVPMMEKAVLSVLMNFPEKLDEASHLTQEHFHSPGLGDMFKHLLTELQDTSGFDLTLFVTRLHAYGVLDRVGGACAISDIFTYQPTPNHFAKHVVELNQSLARRLAVKAALKLAEAAFTSPFFQDTLDAASAPVTAVHEAVAEVKPPSQTKALVKASVAAFLDRAQGRCESLGTGTGIVDIDSSIQGIHPGRMWVIGAYPSGGKSVLAGQILTHLAIHGTPGVFVTLEMTENDLMDRCVIQAAQIPAVAYSNPKGYHASNPPIDEVSRNIEWAAKRLIESKLLIRRPANRTLMAVLATIRRAHRETGAMVAAIDYVQLIRVPGIQNNREQELAEISRAVTELAGELGMHFLLLSQLNADGDTKHGRVIEEDADAFLQIIQEMNKAKQNYRQHQHILVAKDRHHSQGGKRLPIVFDPERIRFVHGYPTQSKASQLAKF